MLLHKTLSLSDVSLKMDGENAGRFSGYASTFGTVDSQGDVLLRGAFEHTLRNHGKPKMFFNHDWNSIPVGKWLSAKEDEHGLLVEGEFTPGLATADAVRAAMKHGTLDGMSIGGFVKVGDWEQSANGERIIRRWSKLVEISPVVFPANDAARVDLSTVKGGADVLEAIEEAQTIREIEQLLRDAAGLSKGAAEALVARIKSVVAAGDPRAVPDPMKQLADRLQALAAGT